MKCLAHKTKSGSRRITITRIGSEYDFSCYGVGMEVKDYIKCPVDCWKKEGIRDFMSNRRIEIIFKFF